MGEENPPSDILGEKMKKTNNKSSKSTTNKVNATYAESGKIMEWNDQNDIKWKTSQKKRGKGGLTSSMTISRELTLVVQREGSEED